MGLNPARVTFSSSCATRRPALAALGVCKVDAFEHEQQLGGLQRHVAPLALPGHAKAPSLETFITQDEMLALRVLRRTLCS